MIIYLFSLKKIKGIQDPKKLRGYTAGEFGPKDGFGINLKRFLLSCTEL